jgi:hypothetical protein
MLSDAGPEFFDELSAREAGLAQRKWVESTSFHCLRCQVPMAGGERFAILEIEDARCASVIMRDRFG